MTFSSKLCVMLQGRIQYIPQMSHMPLTYDGADVLLSPNGAQRTCRTHRDLHRHLNTHSHKHTTSNNFYVFKKKKYIRIIGLSQLV